MITCDWVAQSNRSRVIPDKREREASANSQVEQFDQVVFATHADQSLTIAFGRPRLNGGADSNGAFPYQANEAVCTPIFNLAASTEHGLGQVGITTRLPTQIVWPRSPTTSADCNGMRPQVPLLLTLNESDRIDPVKCDSNVHLRSSSRIP